MLGFCPLASGSKGNALYLGTKNTKLLIDMGLSLRDLTARLASIGVSIQEIEAILITHEHIDHIRGLAALCRKWPIPVLTNKDTAHAIVDLLHVEGKPCPFTFKLFRTGEPFRFADIIISPFSIQHDAIEPVAFTFDTPEGKLGVCADLGFASSLVMQKLQGCRYLYVEANHEPSMVHASSRPFVYKQRVLGKQGHLSNEESGKLLVNVHHADLQHVHLAHLSAECNAPQVAKKVIQALLAEANKEVPLSVCGQDTISTPLCWE